MNFSGRVPQRNVDFWLVFRSDPCNFLGESDKRNFPYFRVSVHAKIPAKILPPSSGILYGRIRREVRGNRQENTGKNAVSGVIRPDLVTGTIDLGHYHALNMLGEMKTYSKKLIILLKKSSPDFAKMMALLMNLE